MTEILGLSVIDLPTVAVPRARDGGKRGGRRSLSTSRRDQSRTWPIEVPTQDKLIQEPRGFWPFQELKLSKITPKH